MTVNKEGTQFDIDTKNGILASIEIQPYSKLF